MLARGVLYQHLFHHQEQADQGEALCGRVALEDLQVALCGRMAAVVLNLEEAGLERVAPVRVVYQELQVEALGEACPGPWEVRLGQTWVELVEACCCPLVAWF